MTTVTLTVNGEDVSRAVAPRTHLADFLREDLDCTGVHIGCEHGVCGACTVIVDGQPERSCITFAVAADGANIRTIEDFDADPIMTALRTAFSARHGLQCGYCTPGVLATAYDIVTRLPGTDAGRIRAELSGNLCRCTGYAGMVQAIQDVAADPPAAADPRRPAKTPETTGAATAAPMRDAPTLGPDANEISLEHDLPLSAADIWPMLANVDTVARCLPGATLESYNPKSGQATGAFAVAIGPMRAAFAGAATVRFDETAKSGAVMGRGQDKNSRTTADGEVTFRLTSTGPDASKLHVSTRYALRGPLAQYSRGAIIEAAAKALMADFASNLAAAASGKTVDAAGPASGGKYAWAALVARIKAVFGK